MISLPLPFFSALVLSYVLARMLLRREGGLLPRLLVLLCIALSVLLGLRYGYGLSWPRWLQPTGAMAVPPLIYLSLQQLADRPLRLDAYGLAPHLGPVLLVALLTLAWPAALDVALVTSNLVYAGLLFLTVRGGPDRIEQTRLDAMPIVLRAWWLAIGFLLIAAAVDVLITVDLIVNQGQNVLLLVAAANGLLLLGFGVATVAVVTNQPPAPPPVTVANTKPDAVDDHTDSEILDRVEAAMQTRQLYRDPDLTLNRLARKLGIPSRQLSGAINTLKNRNVSQYVNGFRIEDACRRLSDPDSSITSAMLDAGFQTKSNFNREFKRVTGLSPTQWRNQRREQQREMQQ